MRKANIADTPKEAWQSPSGKFKCWSKAMNDALGGDSRSMDLTKRWPFDVEISGIAPGSANCPYHSHSNQYEFYLIVSGHGVVRHRDGETEIGPGDYFMFGPNEPHQLINRSTEEMVYHCIADNPIGDHWYYPDSKKWGVTLPERQFLQDGKKVDYFEGEDEPATGWKKADASE